MVLSSFSYPLVSSIVVGILFFLSWIAYGHVLAKALRLPYPLPWGFLACLGASALMLLGGMQAVLGIISETLNLLIMLVGMIFFIFWVKGLKTKGLLIRDLHEPCKSAFFILILTVSFRVASLGIIAVQLLGSVRPFWLNGCDDWITYMHFPKLMLGTGSFVDPFNFRRLVILGGVPYLQSFLYPVFRPDSLPFVDIGLGSILLWGSALGLISPEKASPLKRLAREFLAFLALLLSFAFIFFNYSPIFLPFALLICLLFLSLRIVETRFLPELVVTGIVAAALISIRNNYAIFIGVFSVLFFAVSVRGSASQRVRGFAVVIAVTLLCLSPWLAVSYRSSGTPFFPLLKGFYTFPFEIGEPVDLQQKLNFVMNALWSSKAVILMLPVMIAFFLRKNSRFALVTTLAIISTMVITALSLTASDSYNICRYSHPFLFAGLIALFGALAQKELPKMRRVKKLFLVAGCVAAFIWWLYWPSLIFLKETGLTRIWHKNGEHILSNAQKFYDSSKWAAASAFDYQDLHDSFAYRQVQDFLPGKAHVLSVTAQPFNWDFKRQQIHMIDCPGQASPPPGMPFFSGDAKVVRYLKGLGYRYIVYTPFESPNCLYSYSRWLAMLQGETFIWKKWAPYFLDLFVNIERLERRGALVFQNYDLKVIDIDLIQ